MITFRKLGKLGRFGNQLFQYAGTRLYAQQHNFKSAFPEWIGCKIFKTIEPYTLSEQFRSWFLPTCQLQDLEARPFFKKHLALALIEKLYQQPKDNINLYGYLQDPFSLEQLHLNQSLVKKWFIFRDDIEETFQKATKKYIPWIGTHIRRGDFVKRNKTVPLSLYRDLIKKIKGQYNLYISSDSSEIKSEMADLCPIYPENPLPSVPQFIFDFWMLFHSKILLGCGSTFSWWAAYLGNQNQYFSPPLTHLWTEGYVPRLDKIEI